MAQTAQINIKVDGKQAEGSVNSLNQSIQGATKNTTSLRAELRQVTQELQQLEPGSARFDELSQRAGQLRDTIQDTSAVINATAGSAIENLGTGLQGVATVGIGAFQGVTAAATLFGNENENLQKQLVKLQAAANLAQAINTFGSLGDVVTQVRASFAAFTTQLASSTVVTKIYNFVMNETTVAQVKETISTTAGTIAKGVQTAATWLLVAAKKALTTSTFTAANAMRVLKGAIVATGIGALVVILGECISLLMDMGSETESAADKQEKMAQAAEKTRQKLQDAAAAARDLNAASTGGLNDLERQLKVMTARGADYNAIYEKSIQIKNEELKLLQEQAFQEGINTNEELKNLKGKKLERAIYYRETRQNIMTEMEMSSIARSNAAKEEEEERKRAAQDAANKSKQLADERKREAEAAERDRQDKRKKELDIFNERLQREKDANKELRKLSVDEMVTTEQVGDVKISSITKITEKEQELMKLKIDMDEFEENLIQKGIQRTIQAEEEKWIKSKKPIEDFAKVREQIEKDGINNLLPVELELLEKKKKLYEQDTENRRKEFERLKELSIQTAEKIAYDTAIAQMEFDKQQEIRQVNQSKKSELKKQEEIFKIRQEYVDAQVSQLQQSEEIQQEILYQEYLNSVKIAEEKGEDTTQIESKYQNDRFNLHKDTTEKIQNLEDAAREDRDAKILAQADELAQELDKYFQMVSGLGNALNELAAVQTQNRLNQIDSEYNHEEERLKMLYDSKVISEEEFNDKKRALDFQRSEDELKLKRQQFKREKSMNIIQATMDTALSILSAMKTFGPPPSPLGIIAMAVAAAVGGIQIATISSQQFSAARGGIVPDNGKPSDVDSVPSMLAPGEAVINSRSTAMFPQTLSLINQAGGGIPLVPEMIQQGSSGSGTIFGENQPQQSIRAYVVETEITDTQRRIDRIQRAVEF